MTRTAYVIRFVRGPHRGRYVGREGRVEDFSGAMIFEQKQSADHLRRDCMGLNRKTTKTVEVAVEERK